MTSSYPCLSAAIRGQFFLPAATLWWREIVRFYRQRDRVLGALATPVVFWLLIGAGLGNSFRPPGAADGTNYLEYFFPGTVILILLFTAIFSTISIIEDRREGFLQAVLVAPIPRAAIVLGKLLGGTTLAMMQAVIFLALAPTVGISLTPLAAVYLLVVLFLIGLALTGMGFCLAWRMDSTQGFHAIMNLFLIPMWLLSGALFPVSGAPAWLRWVMVANPLTYGTAALRHGLHLDRATAAGPIPSVRVCLVVVMLFVAASLAASTWIAGRPNKADLR